MAASVSRRSILQGIKGTSLFSSPPTSIILQNTSHLHARSSSTVYLGANLISRQLFTLKPCINLSPILIGEQLGQIQRLLRSTAVALGGRLPHLRSTTCWKCGADSKHPNFCEKCGVIQPIREDANYFEVLGFPVDFNIDVKELTQRFRQLQRRLHPDKFAQRSEEERAFSDAQSSLINKSYQTLLKPMPRGLYLLELYGASMEGEDVHLDPTFLMEIMDTNQRLADTDNFESVRKIGSANQKSLQALMSATADAFAVGDIKKAKETLARLKYYANIDDKVQGYEAQFAEG